MAPADQLARLNERIQAGGVKYYDGSNVDKPLDEGLITEDGETTYRIDDGSSSHARRSGNSDGATFRRVAGGQVLNRATIIATPGRTTAPPKASRNDSTSSA